MRKFKFIAVFLGALVSVGCNPVKSTAEAEKSAAEFHALFDAKEYERIFDTAHADFKASQPKAQTINFIQSVREKLGAVKSTKRTGWQANSFNMKTNAILTFETEFENGKGMETFTYRVEGKDAVLLGWNVNSNALTLTNTKGE